MLDPPERSKPSPCEPGPDEIATQRSAHSTAPLSQQTAVVHRRCIDEQLLCSETDLRLVAAARARALGDDAGADALVAHVEQIVRVHLDENELRRGRAT